MPPDAVPPPPLVTVQVQQMEEEEEEESNDEDDSDYSGEEEEGCGNKRRCRKPANNNKPHKRANRQSNAQDKRESFRALVESNMSTFRGFYREQHRIANERMTPPLICPRSKSGYYYVTPEQTKQYSIRGAHGLRKTKQSFAVSWNSVVFSQLLLDYGLFPGEESVSAEFFDPRDASALNSKMEEWFRSLRL